MRKFISYIRIVLCGGTRILVNHFLFFNRYAKHPEKYSLEKRYKKARYIMSKTLGTYRTEYHVEGLENIESINEKVLFISNHLSEADPVVLTAISNKPITFVAKKQALKMPFIGTILRSIDGIPIDRNNVMNQINDIKKIVETIKSKEKGNVCIFAEGTRNKNPEKPCLEFHGGSIKMGYMAKTKIVPVSIYGTFRIFSIHHFLKKYVIYVKFGSPITPEEYSNVSSIELADKIRDQINLDIERFRKLDKKEVCAQRLSKKRKLYEIKVDNYNLPS